MLKTFFLFTCLCHMGHAFGWRYPFNPFHYGRNALLVQRNFYSPLQWTQSQYPNQNSDLTEPEDICSYPPESGRCLSYNRMFYYDTEDDSCKIFTYGGCGGNPNKFRSQRECEANCKKAPSDAQKPWQSTGPQDLTEEAKCHSPPETGRCLAAQTLFFYDPEDNSCKAFTYGGCGGNANKYRTKQECEESCKKYSQTAQQPWTPVQQIPDQSLPQPERQEGDICSLEPEPGHCYASFQKFYYDNKSGQCRTFVYGGCGGNKNNFQSEEECQYTCGSLAPHKPSTPPTYQPAGQPGRQPYPDRGSGRPPVSPSLPPPVALPQPGGHEPFGPEVLLPPVNGEAQRQCDTSKCPWNLWAHYTERDCKPVYEEGQCCPTSFNCPKTDIARQTNECMYKNRLYFVGADVNVSDPCRVCSCQAFPGEAGKIVCANVECPEGFMPPPQNCYSLYEEGQCCATSRACEGSGSTRDEQFNRCHYGGRSYHLGQKIYFDEDPCMECICSRNFRGPGSPGCSKVQCHMELQDENFRQGCTPIYHPNVCCPIDWQCPSAEDIQQTRDPIPIGPQTDICVLPPYPGPCRSKKARFYYDADLGRCQTFFYGGCQGNENNFMTLSECEQACAKRNQEPEVDICSFPPEKGPCRASRTRFFYDSSDGACKNFVYGGCQGNENNFATREQCLAQCGNRAANREEVCLLYPDGGPCRADKTRYYYDAEAQTCKPFMFGGCQGNGNNFHSVQECLEKCSGVSSFREVVAPSSLDPSCYLEPEQGPCKAVRYRYYYDAEAGDCRNFTFGGCQGNDNNFLNYQQCYAKCVLPSQRVEVKESVCTFGAKTYPVGHSLPKEDPCIECTCKTPPMLTCVRQACRSIPNDDYENCTPIQQAGQCCPEYVCTTPSASIAEKPTSSNLEDLCKALRCPEGQTCKLVDEKCNKGKCKVKCWTEVETELIQSHKEVEDLVPCATPHCPSHCTVGQIPTQRCPTCICAKSREEACKDFECPSGYTCTVDADKCNNGDCSPLCQPSVIFKITEKEVSGVDVCSLPKEPGSCSNPQRRTLKYYYNPTYGYCSVFFYNGCGGNGNRFESREECEITCKLATTPSTNRRITSKPRTKEEACRYFECPPGSQCTADEKACLRGDCRPKCQTMREEMEKEITSDVCSLPKEPGSCSEPQKTSLKYYYNAAYDYCSVFIYSGCGGNKNQFNSMTECEKNCVKSPETPDSPVTEKIEIVTKKPVKTEDVCKDYNCPMEFRCEVDRNNRPSCVFISPDAAGKIKTDSVCSLPKERGSCGKRQKPLLRYYYNSTYAACSFFLFSGCGGNDNRFNTRDECEATCVKVPTTIAATTTTASSSSHRRTDHVTHTTGNLEDICKLMHCPRGYKCTIDENCKENCRPQCRRHTEYIEQTAQSIENTKAEACKDIICPVGTVCEVDEISCLRGRCEPFCSEQFEQRNFDQQLSRH